MLWRLNLGLLLLLLLLLYLQRHRISCRWNICWYPIVGCCWGWWPWWLNSMALKICWHRWRQHRSVVGSLMRSAWCRRARECTWRLNIIHAVLFGRRWRMKWVFRHAWCIIRWLEKEGDSRRVCSRTRSKLFNENEDYTYIFHVSNRIVERILNHNSPRINRIHASNSDSTIIDSHRLRGIIGIVHTRCSNHCGMVQTRIGWCSRSIKHDCVVSRRCNWSKMLARPIAGINVICLKIEFGWWCGWYWIVHCRSTFDKSISNVSLNIYIHTHIYIDNTVLADISSWYTSKIYQIKVRKRRLIIYKFSFEQHKTNRTQHTQSISAFSCFQSNQTITASPWKLKCSMLITSERQETDKLNHKRERDGKKTKWKKRKATAESLLFTFVHNRWLIVLAQEWKRIKTNRIEIQEQSTQNKAGRKPEGGREREKSHCRWRTIG